MERENKIFINKLCTLHQQNWYDELTMYNLIKSTEYFESNIFKQKRKMTDMICLMTGHKFKDLCRKIPSITTVEWIGCEMIQFIHLCIGLGDTNVTRSHTLDNVTCHGDTNHDSLIVSVRTVVTGLVIDKILKEKYLAHVPKNHYMNAKVKLTQFISKAKNSCLYGSILFPM